MAVPVVNARDFMNGWGVNCGDFDSNAANALKFIQTTWIRSQFDGDISGNIQSLQNNLVTAGHADPNLKVNLLLNGYNQSATTNTWNNQKGWLQNNIFPIKGPNNISVLRAIEGPNEMNSPYTGGGCRGPNDTTDKTGSGDVNTVESVPAANLVDWANTVHTWWAGIPSMSAVELCSGTVLNFSASNWPTTLNVVGKVNYRSMHYYSGINGTNGVPSWPSDPDNFVDMYNFAKVGFGVDSSIQTECGISMQTGGGFGQDGRSACRSVLMQLLDHFAVGGHRPMIYNLRNNPGSVLGSITNYNEDNFGIFYGNWVAKPHATMLRNLQNLLALNLNYADSANRTDTTSFTPAYTGSNLTVSGMSNLGSAGGLMAMPKSDGTTAIAVWNEPLVDTGSGTSVSQATQNITLNLGQLMPYAVYDVMGGGNADAFTVSQNATIPLPGGTGSASSISLQMRGNPLIVIVGTAGTSGGGGGSSFTPPTVTNVPNPSPYSSTVLGHVLVG